MSATLKDRVELLERQVKELANAIGGTSTGKSWRATFGTSAGDEGFEEMMRLGRAIRRKKRLAGRTSAGS
jgi:hypothetical protein